jgi:tetratricopeptide (TPR) repeat protein
MSLVVSSAACFVCLVQVSLLGISHWEKNSRAQYWSPYQFFDHVFKEVDYRGVLMNTLYYFGTSYLQQAENSRLDITNLFLSEVFSPHVFNYVTPQRYPLIEVPPIQGHALGEALIKANIGRRTFYWEPHAKKDRWVRDNLLPYGILFRITPSPSKLLAESKDLHMAKLETFLDEYNPSFSEYSDYEENYLYSLILEALAKYFCRYQDYQMAIKHLLVAIRLTPNSVALLNGIGVAYANVGLFSQASEHFQSALAVNPLSPTTLRNLGRVALDTNQYSQAIDYYKRSVKVEPTNVEGYYLLARCYEEVGNIQAAQEAYCNVIRLAPGTSFADQAHERLSSTGSQCEKNPTDGSGG